MLRFLILETFDFPVVWHMVRAGTQLGRIGYLLDVTRFEVGVQRAEEAMAAHMAGGQIERRWRSWAKSARHSRSLVLVASALDQLMPFLSPIVAWSAVLPAGAFHYRPEAVAVLMIWIRAKIAGMSGRRCRPLRCDAGEIFRVGAKAEGDCVVIGGGEPRRLPPPVRGPVVLSGPHEDLGPMGSFEGRAVQDDCCAGALGCVFRILGLQRERGRAAGGLHI